MSDIERLLHGDGTSFEKVMIRSAQREAPPLEAKLHAVAALGISGAAGAVASGAAASGAVIAGKAGLTVMVGKWTAVGVLLGVAAVGAGAFAVQSGPSARARVMHDVPESPQPGAPTTADHPDDRRGARLAGAPSAATPDDNGGATSIGAAVPDRVAEGASTGAAVPDGVAEARSARERRVVVSEAPARAPSATAARTAAKMPIEGAGIVRASSAANAATPKTDTLADELSEIDRARKELAAGNADLALGTLDRYQAQRSHLRLLDEAQVVRVEALLAAGHGAEAKSVGESFLREHPRSPYATHVRTLLGPPKP